MPFRLPSDVLVLTRELRLSEAARLSLRFTNTSRHAYDALAVARATPNLCARHRRPPTRQSASQ